MAELFPHVSNDNASYQVPLRHITAVHLLRAPSHAVYASRPKEIAALIEEAATTKPTAQQ
jgi:hypothetical protein